MVIITVIACKQPGTESLVLFVARLKSGHNPPSMCCFMSTSYAWKVTLSNIAFHAEPPENPILNSTQQHTLTANEHTTFWWASLLLKERFNILETGKKMLAWLRLKVTLFVHQQLNSLLIHLFISHILIHLLSEQLLDNQHSLPSCLLSQNACNSMTSKCWKVHAQEATCSESKARTHKGTNCCRCFSSSITYTVFLSFVCCRKKKYFHLLFSP